MRRCHYCDAPIDGRTKRIGVQVVINGREVWIHAGCHNPFERTNRRLARTARAISRKARGA